MLIKFTSEHGGSFVMFGTQAVQLLNMMGTSGNPEGALRAADLPPALDALRAALQTQPAADSSNEDDSDSEAPAAVGLATRAVPLIDMLEREIAAGGYLMWRPQA